MSKRRGGAEVRTPDASAGPGESFSDSHSEASEGVSGGVCLNSTIPASALGPMTFIHF
jgi:hypothetical protein